MCKRREYANDRQSILVVETSKHYMILRHLTKMLEINFDVFVLIPSSAFPRVEIRSNNILQYALPRSFVYFKLLLLARKFDLVYLSTGPQYIKRTNFAPLIFGYLLFVFIYGRKTILQVRDNASYLRPKGAGIFEKTLSFLRGFSLKYIFCLAFESETLMRRFRERKQGLAAKFFVSFLLYPDLLENPSSKINLGYVDIGLLGAIDPNRKDYSLLYDALSSLPAETCKSLRLILLGRCDDNKKYVIKMLREVCEVEYTEGYLQEDEFIRKGSGCKFLVSPLTEKLNYGTSKGTGSIGDAILLRKNIIIPSHADPAGEFSDFAHYYSDKESLSSQLIALCDTQFRVNQDSYEAVFNKYSRLRIAQNMIEVVQPCEEGLHRRR